MCDNPADNLIDFNIEETPSKSCGLKQLARDEALIPSPRISIDNSDPFELVQKLVCASDDPFDIVEKEAVLKARQNCAKSVPDVKLGNLLSLSEEIETTSASGGDSNIYVTAEDHELENESPPIALSTNWSPCSSLASCESSDSNKEQTSGIKARKTRNHRNRLLKLSISNAAFSTPNSSRPVLDKENSLRQELTEKLVSLPVDNEESSIDSESPVKLVDEDLKLDDSNKKQSYTEKDFDHDLELMEIPMLRQLPSPDKSNNKEELQETDRATEKVSTDIAKSTQLPDLETLRQKLRAKRLQSNDHKCVSELINDFKNLIIGSKMIDEHNKNEVDGLLETLTSTLFATKAPTPATLKEESPQSIVRQGTFDMDLQDDQQVTATKAVPSNVMGQPAALEEMNDAMLKSSATYDGETTEDKAHLNLPQIDPLSPEPKQPLDTNIQGIMEQLQHFLEQQQLSTELSDASNPNPVTTTTTTNPTFIVVMPTMTTNSIGEDTYDSSYSYRRRSQSLSLHDKLKIVQLPIKPVPEVQVTNAYESPPLNTPSSYNTPSAVNFKTPARFLERRNSFSSATPLTPARFSRLNQSIVGKERSSSAIRATTPTQAAKFGLRTETRQPALVPRPPLGLKPDPKKKVRSASSLLNPSAPLKATLPYKPAAPISKNTIPSTTSSASNTSMHLVGKAGLISHTSTPMLPARINRLKPLNKFLPNCPAASSSSSTRPNANSMRLSNIATTPMGKTLSAPSISTANLRRRTISELKVKSPNKPRPGISTLKPNSARSSLRPSIGGNSAHPAIKNKENKKPHH